MSFWKPTKTKKKEPRPPDSGQAVPARKNIRRSSPVVFEAKMLAIEAVNCGADRQDIAQQRAKSQATLDRYYSAFEAGTMAPAVCNKRVEEISNQITQLDEQRQALKDRRSALDLPALRTDFLQEILSNLQGVVDAVPNPQKKHLLHLLVQKVLIKDQHTIEVWYRLPQFPGVRILGQLVAPRGQCANQTNKLRFRQYPHVFFRLSAEFPSPETARKAL